MNYKNIMKDIRTAELITQENMANILGIARSTYKEYELQNSLIPITHLNAFCNHFNISIDYILGFNKEKNYKKSKKAINIPISAKRLKEIRKENKLTQEEMAQKFNIDHTSISKYETGATMISLSFLYQICNIYNISADYLLGKINKPKYFNC